MAENEHAVDLGPGDWIAGSPIIVVCPNCHVQDYYPRMHASTNRACDTCGENSAASEWKVSPKAIPEDRRTNKVAIDVISPEDYLPPLSTRKLGSMNGSKINQVQLLGSLVTDPEVRYTPSGKAVASFTLSIEGEDTNDFPIIAWEELAKKANAYLRKGNRIYIEGKLLLIDKTVIETIIKDDEFGDYEVGVDKYSVQIVAKKIELLDNQQLNKSEPESLQAIEHLVSYLTSGREIIFNVIKELKSLDLENIE
jgi:single stranded DNA-binding protein